MSPSTSSGRFDPIRISLWVLAILTMIFLVAPILVIVVVSFNDSALFEFPPSSWSLRWYAQLLNSESWREAGIMSLWLGAVVTVCALLIGVPAAYAIVRGDFPGRGILEGILISPMVLPVVVLALGLYLLFAKIGLIGTPLALVLAHTLLALPLVVVIVGAAFRRTDHSLELAARSCGASFPKALILVVLPQVRPAILSAGIFAFLTSFDEVVLTLFLGSARTPTIPKKIWEAIKFELDPSLTAISTILIVISITALMLSHLLRKAR